jgi:AraC family transcriptional regulator
MDEKPVNLEAPRFEDGRELLLAGLSVHYPRATSGAETSAGIPAQWQRFAPYIGNLPGQVGRVTYGVRCNSRDPDTAYYMCAVEVSDSALIPPDLARLRIRQQRYAVFPHREHISKILGTWHAIFSQWRPNSGRAVVDAPDFERYGEEFDPRAGTGGVEIWVPIER